MIGGATTITTNAPALDVRALDVADVDVLRLDSRTRLQPEDMRRLLLAHPGRSVWVPRTHEFAIIGPWRQREDVSHVVEFSAAGHPEAVIASVVEGCQAAGDAMVISVELEEVRRPVFYKRIGFAMLEEIVTYEFSGTRRITVPATPLRFVLADPGDDATLASLMQIDHAAFPWLWRNSELEFHSYGLTPGVEIWLGFKDDRAVAYVGLTAFPGWGHLDRIAVDPACQGQGLGFSSLHFAVQRLLGRGARRIGLSTQSDNMRSRRLYERMGFRRMAAQDYRLYGRLLREIDDVS